jgi:hypothetical protein
MQINKISKKEIVKITYLIFSIVSITIGFFLFFYFLDAISIYYFENNNDVFSIFKEFQTADFFMILYSILWFFVGTILYLLFKKIKIYDKNYDAKQKINKIENSIDFFEFQFLKLLKRKIEIIEKMEYEFIENDKIRKFLADDFLIFLDQKIDEIINQKIVFSKPENKIFSEQIYNQISKEFNLEDKELFIIKKVFETFQNQINNYNIIIVEICELFNKFEQNLLNEKSENNEFFKRQILHLKNQFSSAEKTHILHLEKVDEKIKLYNSKYQLAK